VISSYWVLLFCTFQSFVTVTKLVQTQVMKAHAQFVRIILDRTVVNAIKLIPASHVKMAVCNAMVNYVSTLAIKRCQWMVEQSCLTAIITDFSSHLKVRLPILRNLMRNLSTFLLACLFYFIFTFGPKSFVHRWTVK